MEINRALLPAADRLGEIVNGAISSTYFNYISIVFLFIVSGSPPRRAGNAKSISIVFLLYFHHISICYLVP